MTNKQDKVVAKKAIQEALDKIYLMLSEKNESYGNSVYEPISIFSKSDAKERINVRLDDKFSRIIRGSEFPGEDTELDIVGYLVLKMAQPIYERIKSNEEPSDI